MMLSWMSLSYMNLDKIEIVNVPPHLVYACSKASRIDKYNTFSFDGDVIFFFQK
ncbi:hypothetical protein Hanom_Chr13g01213441 [Helianthus anomalus]